MKKKVTVENQTEMRPGVVSRDGFLGADKRAVAAIVSEDTATVQSLGLTHRRIAGVMARLSRAGRAGLGVGVRVPPHFEVLVDSARGAMPCPFLDGAILPKTNTTVRNLKLGRAVGYSDLNIHLIEVHGFYEGRGSAYRLEPRALAEVLEVRARAR
jgi:hypothetical protein